MSSRSPSIALAIAAAVLVAGVAAVLWLAERGGPTHRAIDLAESSSAAGATGGAGDALATVDRPVVLAPSIEPLPASESQRASLSPSTSTSTTARAAFDPPPIPFHGRVIDRASGAPVANALVEVFANGGGAQDQEATTDGGGRFVFERRAWWWFYVRVTAPGYATGFAVTDGVHRDAAQPLAIDLAPAAALLVHLRLPDGSPIADARVVAMPAAPELRQRQLVGEPVVDVQRAPFEATSDRHGLARIEGLPSGDVIQLEARYGGEAGLVARRTIELAPREVRELGWRIGDGATVRVRVVDTAEKGVADASVTLHTDEAARRSSPAFESSTFEAASPELKRLADSGADPAAIQAFLRDARTKRESAANPTLRTAHDGAGVFEHVPPGRYEIRVRLEREQEATKAAWSPSPPPVEVTQLRGIADPFERPSASAIAHPDVVRAFDVGDDDVEVSVRLEPRLAIRGRVVGPAGLAVAGLTVHAVRGGPWSSKSTKTRDDGTFEIVELAPGPWRVRARPNSASRGSREREVEAGASDVELELVLEARALLRIVDAHTGTTLAGKILAFDGSTKPPEDLRTSVGGVIAAAELDSGETTFVAQTDDGRVGVLTAHLAPGESTRPLDILVERGGLGAVRYLGPEPKARIDVAAAGVVIARCEIAANQSNELLLPRGTCTVRAFGADGTPLDERDLTILAGTTSSAVVGAQRPR